MAGEFSTLNRQGELHEEAIYRRAGHRHPREAEIGTLSIKTLCRKHNVTEQTFFRWRNKFGGLDVSDARRLKDLESENARLKRLVAEQMLVIDGMKEIVRKK